jgi:hypothetical protein
MEQKWVQFKNIVTSDCEFGFDEGWDTLVDDALTAIKAYISHKPELSKVCKVHCIKEKFGTLRIYTTKTDEYLNGITTLANIISEHTCELCGSVKGKLRKAGHVQVVCDKCFPDWEKKA